jgi:hypothetical protein
MQRRRRNLRRPGDEVEMLNQERLSIDRRYIELDDAILHGQGSPRILEAGRNLAQLLLLHLTHEEQFCMQISLPAAEDPHAAWRKNMAELLQIEVGLRRGESYAALRLRSFCKGWMHMQKMWTSIFHPSAEPEGERVGA